MSGTWIARAADYLYDFGPFTPGRMGGNNDGKIRDKYGNVVADCGGHEMNADAISVLLNHACMTALPPADTQEEQ